MFGDKKEADAYDKMLELAEQFTALLESQVPNVDAVMAEQFGLLLSKNKETIVQACKGRPELMDTIIHPVATVSDISEAG
ncbi:MAG: dsDNA-binding SOS-regulon protein [Oceanicoccus sp.]|jgi:dsDNA-binding SOS-regulon protein